MSAPGSSGRPPPDLSHLQDNFSEQQAKITALKELVRQSDQSQNQEAQEKVKNIAQRLTVLKSKAAKSRLDRSTADLLDASVSSEVSIPDSSLDMSASHNESTISGRAETPGSEKIQLLRQQMELSRRKMAERESSKRDIEAMMSQLKAKFDDTQQSLHRSQELGRSMGDLSSIAGHSSDRDRVRQLEAKVRILQTELAESTATDRQSDRVKELETKILDLEETIREKDSLISARTQAVTLMSESMSMKGKNTVDLLEDTQQEMVKMQETFVHQELSLKDEIDLLKQSLTEKDGKIANLEEVVDILETTRYDLTVKNAELLNKIDDVKDYSSKLDELKMLNQQLQHRISDLEQQKAEDEDKDSSANEDLQRVNEELSREIEKLKSISDSDLLEKFSGLEKSYQEQSDKLIELEEQLTEKNVELSVLQANYNALDEKLQSNGPKSLFSSVVEGTEVDASSQTEVLKLKTQLDEANKSQIKTKLKMKQMQKQMDSLKKASDQNRQILQLQEENQQLQQKVTELQEGHGRYPETDAVVVVANDTDLAKKIVALEETCQNQTAAINLLEEQKVDLSEDLTETKAELNRLKSQVDARDSHKVKSEISSIELEEQLELYIQDKANLTLQVEDLNEAMSELKAQLRKLKDEKVQLDNDNQKLQEKLDKLSEKVSSAESIEILENLTQQERIEMESMTNKRHDDQEEHEHQKAETLHEEESSELAQKIELFTTERKEVLDKMERVKAENVELITRIEEMEDKEKQLLNELDELRSKCSTLEESLSSVRTESKLLTEKVSMMEKLESDSSTPGTPQKTVVNREALRESLKMLDAEVENYMKCKDKNGKLATSKKLAKQAKQCTAQFRELVETEVPSSAAVGGGGGEEQQEEIARLKGMLLESTSIRVEKDHLDDELKSVRVALLEANNAQEDMRGQISVLLGKLTQKDELLEEHETDTAKLLADIQALQEKSERDSADAGEVDELKMKIGQGEELLSTLQEKTEKLSTEVARLTDTIVECKRRETQFEMERETMKELIEEQKQQLIEQLTEHEVELTEKVTAVQELEKQVTQLLEEMERFRDQVPDNEDRCAKLKEEVQYKQDTIDTLNSQIMDLYKSMDGNATALLEKEDEIVYLRDLVENNDARVKVFEDKCAEYESKIQEMETKLREVEDKNSRAANATDDVKIGLEQRIRELEAIVQELDAKNKEQLEKLKKFAANLKKKVAQCNDLEAELKRRAEATGESSSEQNQLLLAKENELEERQNQIQELNRQLNIANAEVVKQNETIERLDQELSDIADELTVAQREKKELKTSWDDLKRQLENQQDNKESLEKIVQLENVLSETNQLFLDKDQTIAELIAAKVELEQQVGTYNESLQARTKEVEKCKIIIKKRMKEIQTLKQQEPVAVAIAPAESPPTNPEHEAIIQTLRNQGQMYETKIQENALYVESLETENRALNAKIQKLEEGISGIEERRNSMEQKVNLLGATLREKSSEFQQNEDLLVQRLSTLSAHDEVIMNQLTAIQQENGDLLESVEEHIKQERSLEAKARDLEIELNQLKSKVVPDLEQELQQLNYQLSHDAQDRKRQAEELERKLQEKDKEIEEMENELSSQFVKFEEERRTLNELQEKTVEEKDNQLAELVQMRETTAELDAERRAVEEEMHRLRSQFDSMGEDEEEVKELRMQVVQDQMEIEHLKAQNLDLSQSHEQELDRLRCEIINLQESGQIELLRADVERFQRELVEKDRELEVLGQKYSDETKSSQAKSDLIDTLASKVHDINEKQLTDFNDFSTSLNALKGELAQKDHELAQQMGEISRNAQIIGDLQNQLSEAKVMSGGGGSAPQHDVEYWQRLLETKDLEIANYQQRTLQLQMAANSVSSTASTFDPFAPSPQLPTTDVQVDEVRREYEQRIFAMEEVLKSTQEKSLRAESDLQNLSQKYTDTQQHLLERDANIQSLSEKFHETQSLCLERNAEVERLQVEINALQDQLQRESSRVAVNELVQVAEQHVLSAIPIQEETYVQLTPTVSAEQFERRDLDGELQQLKNHLEHVQMQLTEKCLELDMALSRIRELEVKKETKVTEKQVAQVSPQQFPETHNIPAFSTAQFFDTAPAMTAASFFDQPSHASGTVAASLPATDSVGTMSGGDVTDYDNRVPVEEEMIVPKKAYLCYPDSSPTSVDVVQPDASSMTPNVDDSWGWNPEEAALEEQHHRMTVAASNAAPVTDRRIAQLEDKIQELELERDRQRNEIHEFQLKSAKMLKKLKEYKAMNENLSRQKSMDSTNDLDQAIQDELKEQVRSLEQRLREDVDKREKETQERESLTGRIAQLTTTNARLSDARESQELEIERHLTEIRHLRSELLKMNDWGDSGGFEREAKKVEEKESRGSATREVAPDQVQELESKITDLAADNDDLQAILEEERETNRKLEEQMKRINENHSQIEEEAQRRIAELERQLKESVELMDKLTKDSYEIKVHLDRLSSEHSILSAAQANSGDVRELEERVQNLVAELEYKNSDNSQMREKLASQIEALEVAEDNLKAKERVIENLTQEVMELETKCKETANIMVPVLETVKEENEGEDSENLKQVCDELRAEKASMEHELQVLNDQVLASLELEDRMRNMELNYDVKTIEISELKATIEQLRNSREVASTSSPIVEPTAEVEQLRDQIEQLNQYWTEAVDQRGNEVAGSWKSHLDNVQQDYSMKIEALERELEELQEKLSSVAEVKEPTATVENPPIAVLPLNEEDGTVIETMKAALESQEMEIVTLKEQLAIRSAEFAALAARLDPYGHRATSNMASVQPKLGKPSTMGGGVSISSPSTGSSGGAKKREQNELDLALYMLHQRDMRCEELTHELLILLEERDTLQLKWSDCIRQLESSRRNEGTGATTSGESSENSPEKLAMESEDARVGSVAVSGGDAADLDAKLQSIHEATVSRGKALRDERDERLQQMAKLQQDIANIPQEAVSEIVGDYAMAETNQSPSSVLLNWLWGKSGTKPDQ